MLFRPKPKELSLPDKGFVPRDLVEDEVVEGFKLCEDCMATLTYSKFKRCICKDYE